MQCPSCGANATGKFCAGCGAKLSPGACPSCGASLSAGAKFCHACGATTGARTGGGTNPLPWVIAGTAIVALLIVLAVTRLEGPPQNARPPQATPARTQGGMPDLSQMSPRQQADQLFDRVAAAAEQGDSQTVQFFTPMALQAYGLIDPLDADARYHLGVIHLAGGEHEQALAQADSLEQEVPAHLLAALIRAEVAEARGDSSELGRVRRTFLENYAAERGAGRSEYAQHARILERALEDYRGQ